MKRLFRDKRLFIAVCFLGVLAAQRFASYVLQVDGFSCLIDKNLSASHANKIITFLYTDTNNTRNESLSALASKLKDTFHVIKDIKLSQSANGIVHIGIDAVIPKFIVNNEYIISRNGSLFYKTLFSNDIVSDCFVIELKGLDLISSNSTMHLLSQSCKMMLHNIPVECFNSYDLVWEKETKSYLFDKQNKKFAIIFNDFCVPNKKTLSACAKLKTDLKSKGMFARKFIGKWIADIRFKDQIVLFKDVGRR